MSDTPKVFCVIAVTDSGLEHAPAIEVNGNKFPLVFNAPFELPEDVFTALLHSSYGSATTVVESLSPPDLAIGDGDGAAVVPGGDDDGVDTSKDSVHPPLFDPEAVIQGNVGEVTARLAGLTAEQIALVEAAELDREQARKGVLAAIEEAKAALTPPE